MKVFITGGAGFIGSHLCDALVAEGNEVTILDNLSTGSKKNITHLEGKIRVFQGDIRDQNLVESLVANSDLVLHMAAALGVDNILDNPIESISSNLYGSEVVLNACVNYDKRIIIASTSEIYGKNPKQPLSELDDRVIGTPQKLRWTYSDAKALEEATAHFLFLTKNLNVTIIRLFNTVGPRQIGQYGMVIPRFIYSAIRNEPVYVYGSGTQSRVFCHVLDVVEAILKIHDLKASIGEVYNLGGNSEIRIIDLAEKIIAACNSKSHIVFKPYSEAYKQGFEEIPRRVPNISKISSALNWLPTRSIDTVINDILSSKN
jgi:UDP-glucose 4-epimerase